MAGLTWLHLSDWHQKGKEFNRDVVRGRLLEDIKDRVKRISPQVEQVAQALLKILYTPAAERIVYDFTESSWGKRIGPLYNVLCDSLVRVIAGPDSAAVIKEEDK